MALKTTKPRHQGEVQIITREGEVKIKLEIDININANDITIHTQAKDAGGGQKLVESEDNIWSIPDFANVEQLNFGKEVGG